MKKIVYLLLFIPIFSLAQKLPTIEEKTNNLKKVEGFFNYYINEEEGKIWLEISKLDTEVLYQTSLPAGLGSNDIGLDRGKLDDTRIVFFTKLVAKF